MAQVGGKRYFLPAVWGTEALVFNTEQAPMDYGTASLGDLFDPKYVGAVTVRPHSALAAMGRYLDSQGKLPHPFMESYTNMDVMRQNWDIILAEAVKAKPNIAQFWKGENEAQAAFRTNGCVPGQCWDSTGFNLQNDGLPFSYLAPKEGAFAWNQGYMLLKNAKNVEQAHAYANFVATPEGAALHAASFRANPVAKGAIDLADATVATFYKNAFPGDAAEQAVVVAIADQRVPGPAQRVRRQVPGVVTDRGPAPNGRPAPCLNVRTSNRARPDERRRQSRPRVDGLRQLPGG